LSDEPLRVKSLGMLSKDVITILESAPSPIDAYRWAAGLPSDWSATPEEQRRKQKRRIGKPGLPFKFRIGKD